jgi:prephenate dehydrogenase
VAHLRTGVRATSSAAGPGRDNPLMRISLLGLGLIGGSVARALRVADPGGERWELVAWTPSGAGPAAAVEAGVIDLAAASAEVAIQGAGLVVLAAPPLACARLVEWLGSAAGGAGHLDRAATVTDIASTKAALTETARSARVPFVGGHPMAGREVSGFEAADASLFGGRPWVITEAVAGGDPATVQEIAIACGAVPVELGSDVHDRLVASISHLPLLASVALVEAVAGTGSQPPPDWPAAERLAATGWRDTTRLARGDATMGAEIAASNAAAIAPLLRAYRARIDAWIDDLEAPGGPDAAGLRDRLAAARARLEGER